MACLSPFSEGWRRARRADEGIPATTSTCRTIRSAVRRGWRMHLIIPTSYRSQSSCTEFARQIGLPWPACPLPTREGGGGRRESPLSPGKAWSQEKVASSGLCREWEKKPNVKPSRGSSVHCTVYLVCRQPSLIQNSNDNRRPNSGSSRRNNNNIYNIRSMLLYKQ